jgi:hypothetical protein
MPGYDLSPVAGGHSGVTASTAGAASRDSGLRSGVVWDHEVFHQAEAKVLGRRSFTRVSPLYAREETRTPGR